MSFTADGKAVHPVKMKKEQNKNRYVRLWQHVKSNAQNIHIMYAKHITAHMPNIYQHITIAQEKPVLGLLSRMYGMQFMYDELEDGLVNSVHKGHFCRLITLDARTGLAFILL